MDRSGSLWGHCGNVKSNFIPTPTNGKHRILLTHCMFLHELRLYTYRLGF